MIQSFYFAEFYHWYQLNLPHSMLKMVWQAIYGRNCSGYSFTIYLLHTHSRTSNPIYCHCIVAATHWSMNCCMFWWFYCFSSFHFYNECRHRSCGPAISNHFKFDQYFDRCKRALRRPFCPPFGSNDDNPFIGFT